MTSDQWTAWILAVRAGDEQASEEFWQRYAKPLIRLTDQNLKQRLKRRVDPEDVVQSAFRTALRRLQDGQFELSSDDQLWRLLCAITLNKTRRQVRRHSQQSRSIDREEQLGARPLSDVGPADGEPTPVEAASLVELVERVLHDAKDDEHRQVLRMKLDGHTNAEIAAELNRSERTVRRISSQLKTAFTALLEL